jgi:16S rRNA (guanine966-N2)-methyltransferase
VREALFNILGPQVQGARFLDLYAGSGSVGLEALSRGARQVHFVEQDPCAAGILEENLRHVGFPDEARVWRMAVRQAWSRLEGPFQLVFADPPYRQEEERQWVLERLGAGGWLLPESVVIVEHPGRKALSAPEGLHLAREARYGDTGLAFLEIG